MKRLLLILFLTSQLIYAEKTAHLNLNFKNDQISIKEKTTTNVEFKYIAQSFRSDSYKAEVIDSQGNTNYTTYFNDPLLFTGDYEDENGKLNHFSKNLDSATYGLKIPYSTQAKLLKITTPQGDTKILTLDQVELRTATQRNFKLHTISESGDKEKRINVVFMGDGYTAAEMDKYRNDVTGVYNAFINEKPLNEYQKLFNGYAIEVISDESGCRMTTTETKPVTYFKSSFNSYNIDRLLCIWDYNRAENTLATDFDGNADIVFIVVNTTKYGGSGGQYSVFSMESSSKDIAIHEAGHSYGRLADEYFFKIQEAPNQSSTNNKIDVRWNRWIGQNGINFFQHEGENAYKPTNFSCMMEALHFDFCSVCQEHLILTNYNHIKKIESFYPPLSQTPNTIQKFKIKHIIPTQYAEVKWLVNDKEVATNVDSIEVNTGNLNSGSNKVMVKIQDINPKVIKKDMFLSVSNGNDVVKSGLLADSLVWNFSLSGLESESQTHDLKLNSYPNPFNNSCNINYYLASDDEVELSIFSANGQKITTLFKSQQKVGAHNFSFDGSKLNSGVYFYQLKTKNSVTNQKMILLK